MSQKPRLLVTIPLPPKPRKTLQNIDSIEVVHWPEGEVKTSENMAKHVQGCSGILCSVGDKITSEVLDAAGEALKVVSTVSVGYEHIDLTACKNRGIQVGYTPDVLTDATADTTATLTMMATRGISDAIASVKDGRWGKPRAALPLGMQLPGKIIGFLGLGRIGYATALRLRAFGASQFIYHNRGTSRFADDLGARRVEFPQLLAQSDVLIITASLTSESRHLFRKETLAQMKSHAVLVNTARGGFIHQEDLAEALSQGIIGAAGLDVTDPEPIDPSHPLVHLPNCTILPHIGSATLETRNAMGDLALENVLNGMDGKALSTPL
ncbi:D-isomer specific 2-hydroxyacid dehydrogenase [Piptocephalis cylindrospora]|uniref:D-isomer specific 2-hydroxyacid dehydrogenase n=1 Tax=Piptocephalis cylindrospora TaxID=1907219 RepID=A0A4P9Y7C3_9FUNG|nr:D-isomer specific 2-hydroxyacid dehydrogenase [Piptocephalis cylindrospora]|eukprot:RKP15027.1 D-isomer specific 2-hydroxyacid dehydrogenase [Piptocephalis cylindrospora]